MDSELARLGLTEEELLADFRRWRKARRVEAVDREPSLCGRPTPKSGEIMKKVYDFSKGKRGAVIPTTGKTRITIYMDDAIVSRFKAQSEKTGKGYQTLINEALKAHLGLAEQPVTQDLVRKIVREELAAHG